VSGPKVIASLSNERVKFIRSLAMRKVRRRTGLFIAQGASVIVSARDAGWTPRILVYQLGTAERGIYLQLDRWAEKAQAERLEVGAAVLGKLAATDNPQTMLGVFEQRWHAPPQPRSLATDDVWLALEAPRDPGNLGTITRTVEAVGARGIILIGAACDPFSPESVRASMGSIFAVPFVRLSEDQFKNWVKGWQGDVIGTHLASTTDFRSVLYRGPSLLIMGSEGPGLSQQLAEVCTQLVKIPMAGKLDSLNLAIATALTLYQIRSAQLHV
jgi:RNA methyltransferase, TrmH family